MDLDRALGTLGISSAGAPVAPVKANTDKPPVKVLTKKQKEALAAKEAEEKRRKKAAALAAGDKPKKKKEKPKPADEPADAEASASAAAAGEQAAAAAAAASKEEAAAAASKEEARAAAAAASKKAAAAAAAREAEASRVAMRQLLSRLVSGSHEATAQAVRAAAAAGKGGAASEESGFELPEAPSVEALERFLAEAASAASASAATAAAIYVSACASGLGPVPLHATRAVPRLMNAAHESAEDRSAPHAREAAVLCLNGAAESGGEAREETRRGVAHSSPPLPLPPLAGMSERLGFAFEPLALPQLPQIVALVGDRDRKVGEAAVRTLETVVSCLDPLAVPAAMPAEPRASGGVGAGGGLCCSSPGGLSIGALPRDADGLVARQGGLLAHGAADPRCGNRCYQATVRVRDLFTCGDAHTRRGDSSHLFKPCPAALVAPAAPRGAASSRVRALSRLAASPPARRDRSAPACRSASPR